MSELIRELKLYAVTAADSRGREHPESFGHNVDPYAVDRQRVLRSAAFRRLQHKTQVFVTSEHDHFRTRLTHTLEVASVARRLCVGLQVNSAVGELIALTHDLGHPPFGHAGETALADLMAHHGGFEHNAQSLRVVEFLEHPYPAYRGLNMTYEVRESLAKHCTLYDRPGGHPLADGTRAPIEGQIANLADRVAYNCHDIEDAFGAGLVSEGDLEAVELWRKSAGSVRAQWPDAPLAAVRRPILDELESLLLKDIVSETRRRIQSARIETLDDVRQAEEVVAFSTGMAGRVGQLETFLLERVYRHRRLIRMDDKARRFVRQLFEAYVDEPKLLPSRYHERIGDLGLHRVVCDYLAGMTDRFCQEECRRLFEPFESV